MYIFTLNAIRNWLLFLKHETDTYVMYRLGIFSVMRIKKSVEDEIISILKEPKTFEALNKQIHYLNQLYIDQQHISNELRDLLKVERENCEKLSKSVKLRDDFKVKVVTEVRHPNVGKANIRMRKFKMASERLDDEFAENGDDPEVAELMRMETYGSGRH